MSEVVTSDAGDAKPAVETNKPMTDKDFLSSRIAKLTGKDENSVLGFARRIACVMGGNNNARSHIVQLGRR